MVWCIRNVEYVFKAFVPNKINTKTYNNMAYRQICVYYMFVCIIFSRVWEVMRFFSVDNTTVWAADPFPKARHQDNIRMFVCININPFLNCVVRALRKHCFCNIVLLYWWFERHWKIYTREYCCAGWGEMCARGVWICTHFGITAISVSKRTNKCWN